ncbi:uncharacterized protein METZ01_LOCUS324275 [marine metagenome]|uniref:Uncharacterized protein n=1 Tax=marine metagenome TaxID=408172 RepID=A0A382PHM5_9ZZZZ
MSIIISELAQMDDKKRDVARVVWRAMKANLVEWTPEVSKAKPHGLLYHIKYKIVRFPYTMTSVPLHWSESVKSQYGYITSTIKNEDPMKATTKDHLMGSYVVGEYAMDRPDIYLADGTLDKFTEELFPYMFLTNYVTNDENDKLSNLKGKILTKDKYETVGIVLYNRYGQICENPLPPESLTLWESEKYRIGNTLNAFLN